MSVLTKFISTRLLSGFIGIGTPILMARGMEIDDYATFTLSLACAILLSTFTSLGMDRVAYRFLPAALHNPWGRGFILRFLSYTSAIRFTLVGSVLLVLETVLGSFDAIGFSGLQNEIHWTVAFTLAYTASNLMSDIAHGVLLFERQAAFTLFTLALRLLIVLTLYLIFGQLDLDWMFLLVIGTELILAGALLWVVLRLAGGTHDASEHPSEPPTIAEMWRVGLANYWSYLASFTGFTSVQRILLGSFAGTTEIASFGFQQSLADRAKSYLPTNLMQSALEPLLVSQYGKGVPLTEITGQLDLMRRLNAVLLGSALVLLGISGYEIIALISSGKFQDYWWISIYLCVQYLINTSLTLAWTSFNIADRLPTMTKIFASTSLIFMPVMVVLAERLGSQGILIASILQSITFLIAIRFIFKLEPAYGLWRIKRDMGLYAAMAICISGGLLLKPLIGWLTSGLLGMLIFYALLLAIRYLTKDELQALKQLVDTRQ